MSVPYALYAKESGSSIPGPAGEDGEDGVGITSTTNNGDGTFTLNFSDGSSFTTSNLTGSQGNDGADGENGVGITSTTDNGNGTFTLNYSDGSSFTTADLTGPQGATGPQGPIGASGNDGNDGIDGQDGENGVGITSTTDNGNGTFTLNFSDGSDFTTSDLTGPQNTDTYTKSEVDNLIAGLQSQIDDFHPPTVNYDVTASGFSAYIFNGGSFTNASNPDLTLKRGRTYTFTVNASGHPFYINTLDTTGTSNTYTSGVTNNGVSSGTITFTVPDDAPNTLYYNCQYHSSMNGTITITD